MTSDHDHENGEPETFYISGTDPDTGERMTERYYPPWVGLGDEVEDDLAQLTEEGEQDHD